MSNWASDPESAWKDEAHHGEPARVLMSNGKWLVPESERPQIAPPSGYELTMEIKRIREDLHSMAWFTRIDHSDSQSLSCGIDEAA